MAQIKLLLNEDDGDYCAIYVDGKLKVEFADGPIDPGRVIKALVGEKIDSFKRVQTSLPFFDKDGNELEDATWPKTLK